MFQGGARHDTGVAKGRVECLYETSDGGNFQTPWTHGSQKK